MIIALLTPFNNITKDDILDFLDYLDSTVYFYLTDSVLCPTDTTPVSFVDFVTLPITATKAGITHMVIPSNLEAEQLAYAERVCNKKHVTLLVMPV